MTALFSREQKLPTLGFPFVAVDTETARFLEPKHDDKRRTRHEPFQTPDLILGSISDEKHTGVLRPKELEATLIAYLSAGYHLVFHNCAFDIPVLRKAFPGTAHWLDSAVEEGRVHDTAILEQLIQIARGSTCPDERVLKMPRLSDLAKRRAGMDLDKNHDIRTGFDRYADPSIPIPETALSYAADDALATYRVFVSQWKEAELYADPTDSLYPVFDDPRSKFGLLSEGVQIKGALALRWLEGFPLRVDLPSVYERRDKLRAEARSIEPALVDFGFAKVTPRSRQFKLSHTTLRRTLAEYSRVKGITPQYSDSGLVSLGYDFWARELPKPSDFLLDHPESATGLESQLLVWLRYCKVHKLLATYLEPYGTNAEHYPTYWNLGARTGRVSCVRPNVQNIPKHGRDGIRELFVPRSGHVLIEADFKAAELVALAQIFHMLYGSSVLGDAINAGLDPHIETAKRLVGDGWDALDEKAQKRMRQAAKAVNFGLPGGLGAAKFKMYANKSYGLSLSEPEAKDLRARALEASPELQAYLSDSAGIEERFRLAAQNLNTTVSNLIGSLGAWRDEDASLPHWRLAASRLRKWMLGDETWTVPSPPGFNRRYDLFRSTTWVATGRPRGRASYTEAHNTPFQGLVADGAKLALWNLYRAWHPTCPWVPVAFVHDSILIEVEEGASQHGEAENTLSAAMIEGLAAVCPDMNVQVDVTQPLTRWGAPAQQPTK